MATVTKERTKSNRKPRPKLARRARLERTGEGRYVLLLSVGELQTGYYLSSQPADYGTAFRFEKFASDGGDVYDVNLNAADGSHSCTCKGHTYRDRCRHVEALVALQNVGRI